MKTKEEALKQIRTIFNEDITFSDINFIIDKLIDYKEHHYFWEDER